jgi:hypothetical protein
MEYPNTITWDNVNYTAPKGYYFLESGDHLIEGDGYFNGKCIVGYIIHTNLKVEQYYISPSVRRIPAEKAPAPAKLQYKLITSIEPGDVFACKEFGGNVITRCKWEEDSYSLCGNDGLNNYFNAQAITKAEMLIYLNKYEKIFITNINDKINKTIDAGMKMV